MTNDPILSVYFDDPRLRMTMVGRMMVRFSGYVSYIVLMAATITFLASDLTWLVLAGVLLSLFLMDRLVHRKNADKSLAGLPKEGTINLAQYLSPRAFLIIERAWDRTILSKKNLYLELLRELLQIEEVRDTLMRLDVTVPEFRQQLEDLLKTSPASKINRNDEVETLVVGAFQATSTSHHRYVQAHDLLAGIAKSGDPIVDRLLQMFSIESGDLERAALFGSIAHDIKRVSRGPRNLEAVIPSMYRGTRHRIMNRAWTSRPTPILDEVSVDLTDLARRGLIGFMVGHEKEYSHMLRVLSRSTRSNVMLIGEPTIGKETIVSHLALCIIKDIVPPELFDKRLLMISLAELAAASAEGGVEQRMSAVLSEISRAGNVLLYIPDLHELVRGGGGEYLSLADSVLSAIKEGVCPVIGATFPREYKTLLEPRTDITGLFEAIHVEEITPDEAERVLVHDGVLLEAGSNAMISFGAIKKAVEIGSKYIRDTHLPASALELLREATRIADERNNDTVHPQHVVEVAEAKTNVPIHEASATETKELLNLEEIIHATYVDQEEAVRSVADALREYRSGLARTNGPIASFLFVGPTGVGKTELAKQIAKIQFGSEEAMARFDMSEYQEQSSIERLIGSSDGSVHGGLTEAVREKPYSVILLDEFEKAHPDILNLFLPVFDDGRLTDTLERVIDFKNTIIIATSNAKSEYVIQALRQGQPIRVIADSLKEQLVSVFRPELINRFSRIIVFAPLGKTDVRRIAELQLNDFGKQLGVRGYGFQTTREAVELIAELGYDPTYGARPLRGIIEEQIKAPLAKKVLADEFRKGGTITVIAKDGKIMLQ